jgi:hypothetical protein
VPVNPSPSARIYPTLIIRVSSSLATEKPTSCLRVSARKLGESTLVDDLLAREYGPDTSLTLIAA